MKLQLFLIIFLLFLFKNFIYSLEYENEILNDSSSEKWNFDEIDKILEGYKELKKFGKVLIVYHTEEKNHTFTENGIQFKLNNNLVFGLGKYIQLEEEDHKILLSMFQSKELKNYGIPNYYSHISKNWYSVHFMGDINNPILKDIDKTITWNSNSIYISKMCCSLQNLFIKYNKKFIDLINNDEIIEQKSSTSDK